MHGILVVQQQSRIIPNVEMIIYIAISIRWKFQKHIIRKLSCFRDTLHMFIKYKQKHSHASFFTFWLLLANKIHRHHLVYVKMKDKREWESSSYIHICILCIRWACNSYCHHNISTSYHALNKINIWLTVKLEFV